MDRFQDNILVSLKEYLQSGKVAIATVMKTWGSSPRPIGSQLIVKDNGEILGSVSGGCVEGAVVTEALLSIKDGQCRILDYGVTDENAFSVGLACGGKIKILVEPIGFGQGPSREFFENLLLHQGERTLVGYAVNLKNWKREFLFPNVIKTEKLIFGYKTPKNTSLMAKKIFFSIAEPQLKLIVIGAVHIAQNLIPIARLAGYAIVLIDPRSSFASEIRFPDTEIMLEWPDNAMVNIGLDKQTAVITLSHDPKIDDPAVIMSLNSEVFFLGCLGSIKTHKARIERLKLLGYEDTNLSRIHAPVGLDIGSISPSEIAISIMAQITNVLREGKIEGPR